MFQLASGAVRPGSSFLGRAAVVLVLLVCAFACRSAAPDLTPSAPVPPKSTADEAAPAPSPTPGTALPSETGPAADADSDPGPADAAGDATAVTSDDEPSDAPQDVQKEALDLCQSAKELFDGGKVDEALAATDHAYELMLSLPASGDDAYLQAKEDIRILVGGPHRSHLPLPQPKAPRHGRFVGPGAADHQQRPRSARDPELHHRGAGSLPRRLPPIRQPTAP